jgi:outer membrane protein assembly factor BamB
MRLHLGALLVVSMLLSGCSDDVDLYEPDPLVEIENKFEVKAVWSTSIGDGIGSRTLKLSPFFAYGKIYVADAEGVIAAIDPENGKKVWEVETELPIAGGPAVSNKILAVGTSQGEIVAFDADTGKEQWRSLVSSEIISTPAIGDGYVAVRTVDGKIYLLDASNGEEKWFYDESLPPLTLRGNSAPVIANGGVVAGFSNGKLAVFILENGQLAWEKKIAIPIGSSEIQRLVDVDLQPILVGPSIYIGSFNGNLASLDYRNGEFNWQRELSTFQDMAVNDLLLFVTHENSHVSAVNRTNGVIIWTQKDLNRRQLSSPAVMDKHIIVGDYEGYLHWISTRNGTIESRFEVDSSGISATPIVVEDKVIIYTRDGTLKAFQKEKM